VGKSKITDSARAALRTFSDRPALVFGFQSMQKSNKYFSYTRKRSPEASCKFTVQEAFSSMLRFKKAGNDQEMTSLSRGRSLTSGRGFLVGSAPEKCGHQLQEIGSSTSHRPKSFGYASSFRKDPSKNVVTPALQEFALKSVPIVKRRTKRKENQIVGDIQDEIRSIVTISDELLEGEAGDDESWSRSSQVSSSSSEALSDGRDLWEDDESERERERKRRNRTRDSEQNFGHAIVSFIPIPW
jgi:hypothetical protein